MVCNSSLFIKFLKLPFFILIFGLFIVPVWAHQPRIVENGVVTEIKNPEVSQAFYGELNGQPEVFRINAEKPFKLYVGLLVPDVPEAKKDLSVEITSGGQRLFLLDGTTWDWKRFYEEFGGDWYWWGPETAPIGTASAPIPNGTYDIKVFSSSNLGKYSLAIGEIESFPLNETLNTIVRLPWIKASIFDKSPLTAFFNLIGLMIFGPLLALIGLLALGLWIFVRLKRRRRRHSR